MMEYLQKSEDAKQKTNNHQTKEALMHLNDKIAIASQLQWGIQALDFSMFILRRVTLEVEIQESGRLLRFFYSWQHSPSTLFFEGCHKNVPVV